MAWEHLDASYDRVASKYEARFLDELDRKPRDRQLLAAFAASVANPVVEIGCGPGQVGAFVREHGRAVAGIDLSAAMATLAATRLDGAAMADMRMLPIATGSCGGVLAFYSLIHLRRAELVGALCEVCRVLRRGGHVLIAAHEGEGEFHADEFLDERVPFAATLWRLGELTDACEQAGLDVVDSLRRAAYPDERTVRLYVRAERPDTMCR
jgi:SAM-dependent methyltransferase